MLKSQWIKLKEWKISSFISVIITQNVISPSKLSMESSYTIQNLLQAVQTETLVLSTYTQGVI
jgi:hypothetical protein